MNNEIEILYNLKKEVEFDIDLLIEKMNDNLLIKFVLQIMEDIFNLNSSIFLSGNFQKEALAESLSYLLYRKINNSKNNIKFNLKVYDDYINFVNNNYILINKLFHFLRVKYLLDDMITYVSRQDYILVNYNNILELQHKIKDFDYYYKLGYFRNMLENIYVQKESEKNSTTMKEILDLVNRFKSYFKVMDFYIKDAGSFNEQIIFSLNPRGLYSLSKFLTHSHKIILHSTISNYLINNNKNPDEKCRKEGNLKWIDLISFSIIIQYIAMFINNTIEENSTSARMSVNSKILSMNKVELEIFFYNIFNSINNDISFEEVKDFINKFTTYTAYTQKRIDIQFNPIINIEDYYFVLVNVFSQSDITRAYIDNFSVKLDENGSNFEESVFNILKIKFNNIYREIKYIDHNNKKGEIDLLIISNNNIYFIECKNRLKPISSNSSINNYQYFLKAVTQLNQAEEYFNNDKNRFLKRHIKDGFNDINDYKIYKVIIMSNPNLSGLIYENVAVRDIISLDRLINKGNIRDITSSIDGKEQTVKNISLYQNNEFFQEIDFINYLSMESIFFKYLKENIVQIVTEEIRYKNYILKQNLLGYKWIEEKE